MYELVQAGAHTYYVDCPCKVGVVVLDGTQVCLIDAGSDRDAGKKICKILTQRGWHAAAIYNTHAHADHIGGNRVIQEHFGCPAYAPGADAALAAHPVLEPTLLYGGYPCKALRGKFLMAQQSEMQSLMPDKLPRGMQAVRLDGHSLAMMAFKTPDNIWFVADAVASEATLQKYHVSFLYDAAAVYDSFKRLETLQGALFVPAHADAVQDIRPLVAKNRAKLDEVLALLCAICAAPCSFDVVLKAVFDHYALAMDITQYALVGSTVRSCLAYLCDTQRMCMDFTDNVAQWHTLRANA